MYICLAGKDANHSNTYTQSAVHYTLLLAEVRGIRTANLVYKTNFPLPAAFCPVSVLQLSMPPYRDDHQPDEPTPSSGFECDARFGSMERRKLVPSSLAARKKREATLDSGCLKEYLYKIGNKKNIQI